MLARTRGGDGVLPASARAQSHRQRQLQRDRGRGQRTHGGRAARPGRPHRRRRPEVAPRSPCTPSLSEAAAPQPVRAAPAAPPTRALTSTAAATVQDSKTALAVRYISVVQMSRIGWSADVRLCVCVAERHQLYRIAGERRCERVDVARRRHATRRTDQRHPKSCHTSSSALRGGVRHAASARGMACCA